MKIMFPTAVPDSLITNYTFVQSKIRLSHASLCTQLLHLDMTHVRGVLMRTSRA
jgi:hypothetical protein